MHCASPLLFDMGHCISPCQVEYALLDFSQDICKVVVEEIHLSLLLGLLVDKVAITMYLGLQAIIPSLNEHIVDLKSL